MCKYYTIVITLLLTFIALTFVVEAQEKKSSISSSVLLSHYFPVTKGELNLGDKPFNIGPGLEVLYNYKLTNIGILKTGLSYQYIDMQTHLDGRRRFKVGEISIPVLLEYNLSKNTSSFSVCAGLHAGKFLHFSWYNGIRNDWYEIDLETVDRYPGLYEEYSDKNFFMDLYFDLQYAYALNSKSNFLVAPFIHYRFKENWMEYHRKSFYCGIKTSITVNLLNKYK